MVSAILHIHIITTLLLAPAVAAAQPAAGLGIASERRARRTMTALMTLCVRMGNVQTLRLPVRGAYWAYWHASPMFAGGHVE